LCVYDLTTGQRNFLSDPPDTDSNSTQCYVLLTNADRIGCSFMLLFAEVDFAADNIQVQTTTTSTCGTWAQAAIFHKDITSLNLQCSMMPLSYTVVSSTGWCTTRTRLYHTTSAQWSRAR
jgi:PhoPQ-activated pathogenicity-related protein